MSPILAAILTGCLGFLIFALGVLILSLAAAVIDRIRNG